jgi:hypothetical protein
MPKRRKKRKPPAPSRFKVGDQVRVKHGVMDTEYPDMPLGGWAGKITEVDRRAIYTVQRSPETLANIHPVYKKRCERDGMVLEEYWLQDEDLEPDTGGPLSIEQPTQITPRPLSPRDQDDRVRMVFGLTSDDLLPNPDEETLETYYDYLAESLSFPFEARYREEDDPFSPLPARRVKVVALGSDLDLNEEDGILCETKTAEGEDLVPLAELELRRSDPNRQLVDDHAAWFVGELVYDDDEEGDEEFEDDEDLSLALEEATRRSVALLMLEITAFAASYGAVMGAAVAVMSWAKWGACIGSGLLGVFVAVAQAASAQKDMPVIAPSLRKGFAGIVGLITGAVQGAFFGVMAVAFVGAILGGIVGLLLRRVLGGTQGRFFHFFPGSVVFAAACGVAAQAFCMNHAQATEGLFYGALVGLGAGLFFGLVGLPLAYLTVRRL